MIGILFWISSAFRTLSLVWLILFTTYKNKPLNILSMSFLIFFFLQLMFSQISIILECYIKDLSIQPSLFAELILNSYFLFMMISILIKFYILKKYVQKASIPSWSLAIFTFISMAALTIITFTKQNSDQDDIQLCSNVWIIFSAAFSCFKFIPQINLNLKKGAFGTSSVFVICEMLWGLFLFANILFVNSQNTQRIIENLCFLLCNLAFCILLLWQKRETKLKIQSQRQNQQKLLNSVHQNIQNKQYQRQNSIGFSGKKISASTNYSDDSFLD